MKSTWTQAREVTPREGLETASNGGEDLKAAINAAFEQLATKAGRRFVYSAVCDAIVNPERLSYEVALVISGKTRDEHIRVGELLGDVSELVLEEAKERLAREPEEVLDELDRAERAHQHQEGHREPEEAMDEFD